MARLNTTLARPVGRSFIQSEITPSGKTYNGAPGYARDTKSELFLLAVSTFGGEPNYYETAQGQDNRFVQLVRAATAEDCEWTAAFLKWLRADANMRTSAVVGAAEYTKTSLELGIPGSRKVIDSVLLRADEPGEFIAYWTSRYGRNLPMPVKRGVGDALIRLGSEFNYLKWDSESRGYRFADLLNLCHPGDKRGSHQVLKGRWQSDLFEHIVGLPYRPDSEIPESLATLTRRKALMSLPVDERRAALDPIRLRDAGMTWESLAGWLQGPMDKEAWEAIIPNMGYMALLRNLRNFDNAAVSNEVAAGVMTKLADPIQVAKSRQFPLRLLSAYKAAPSLRWAWPLEQALAYSVGNIPRLSGRTLILVDTSGSMSAGFSKDGKTLRWDAAALFGIALAGRCDKADLVSFSGGWYSDRWGKEASKAFTVVPGESVLRGLARWQNGFNLGGGTDTVGALQRHYGGHDRVLILTDEQANSNHFEVGHSVPPEIPLYTWNLSGYQFGHAPSAPKRHTFGGLTDTGFRMIPLIEAGYNAVWPWETTRATDELVAA